MLFLSAVAGRFRMRGFLVWGMSLAVLRFALFAFGAETGTLLLIYAGIALHGPVYTFVTVAGRVYLDKRVPETLQGQAQALYSLLVFNLAGIVGAFVCEWLYQVRVESASNWLSFWLILSALAALPLLYFTLGLLRQSSNEAC
jgi:MFS family permease